MFTCDLCNYTGGRKDNFDRHLTSKKHQNNVAKFTETELQKLEKQQKELEDRIVELKHGIVAENKCTDEDTKQDVYSCKKCKATYKTLKYFTIHTDKCKGIDSMTCPRCMKTFTDSGNKSRHIKRNLCQPVSIFDHICDKLQKEVNNNGNISNSTVNSHNTYNTYNNNHYEFNTNIYINNYGQERTDYITYDVFFKIAKDKAYHIIPEFFRVKHLHPNFPENHNIRCKNNEFFIKQNGRWNKITKHNLSNKIFNNCGNEVYCNREKYKERIKTETGITKEKMKDIEELTDYVKLEQDDKDIAIKNEIIALIGGADVPPEYVLNANKYHDQLI